MGLNVNAMKIDGLSVPINTLAELAVLDATKPENVNTLRLCSDATPPALVFSDGAVWISTDDGTEAA
jgi:hypothetical protein